MNTTTYNRKQVSALIKQYHSNSIDIVLDIYSFDYKNKKSSLIKDLQPADEKSFWNNIKNIMKRMQDIQELQVVFKDVSTGRTMNVCNVAYRNKNEAGGEQEQSPASNQHQKSESQDNNLGLGDIGAIVQFEIEKLKTGEKIQSLEKENEELKSEIKEKDKIIEEYEKKNAEKKQIAFFVNAAREIGFPAIASKLEGLMGFDDEDNPQQKQITDVDPTGIIDDDTTQKSKIAEMKEEIISFLHTIENERDMARIYKILYTCSQKPELLPMLVSLVEGELSKNQ